MSSTLRQLSREIREQYAGLSIFLAESFINRALEETYQRRLWSHHIEESQLVAPAEVTTGTVDVVQGSRLVTFSAAARALLDAFGANPLLTACQFRVGSGPLYSIIAYDDTGDTSAHPWNTLPSAGAAYLDKPYQESTDSASTYRIYRAYYDPPLYYDETDESASVAGTTDFLRFLSVRDVQLNYRLTLDKMRAEIDAFDNQRTTTGNPRYLASYKSRASGVPRFEMYPHPTARKSYPCIYQRRGQLLESPSDALPSNIPGTLIVELAHVHASKWAMKNVGQFKELQGIRWGDNILAHQRRYDDILQYTKKLDEEMVMRNWILPPSSEWGMAIGAQYTIDHATYAYTL